MMQQCKMRKEWNGAGKKLHEEKETIESIRTREKEKRDTKVQKVKANENIRRMCKNACICLVYAAIHTPGHYCPSQTQSDERDTNPMPIRYNDPDHPYYPKP